MITLHPLRQFRYPVTAECISPDVYAGKKPSEIESLKLWEGNKQKTVGELFKVEETKDGTDDITINGDMNKVRKIGTGMTKGNIMINGDAGMHLGLGMKGGTITVHGNVGGWAGSLMKGGEIEIHGNAGDYVAAPYRGCDLGMSGGRIMVHGNAGSEAGAHMKKGLIKIDGSAGQFVGFRMRNGTILVRENCGDRAGACMIEGKIVVAGALALVLPSFAIDSVKPKVKIEEGETLQEPFYVFLGDIAENGNGKLYVSKQKNPHLSHYERFL